jgi:DNA processing protein
MDGEIRELGPKDVRDSLLEIPEPPKRLYLRGTLPPKNHKLLTVVGSRAVSAYGKEVCTRLIAGLRGYPISIVSGLALGTDASAHRAALSAGLHTIAVPGSGLADSAIYQRSNVGLAMDILRAGGALVSEQEPNHKPYLAEFPSRNRIMVGLSDAVLVIEAGAKSGTLITARLAGEYNRELLLVPHRIGDPHGFGAHLFLRLGGTLCAEPAHILEALALPFREGRVEEERNLEGNEKILYDLLLEPLPRDELIRASKLPPSDALSTLVTLQLKGVLKEEFGAWRRA